MIVYNPKEWFGLIFTFHKAETFSRLKWIMLSISLYAALVVFLEFELLTEPVGSTIMHSLLGFIISLLLVFRTNTAYDRWWEGRKQWGALVNVSRNFALKLTAFKGPESLNFKELIALNSAYSRVLKEHLRLKDPSYMVGLLPDFLNANAKNQALHVPNFVAGQMQRRLHQFKEDENLDTASYLALLQDLNQFTDICGACERIRKTPIPYTYNIFLKKFIFVYIISMPFAFAPAFGYWTILATVFTFYTFASLELIAEEIEDPFGEDSNDLPTDDLAETIGGNVREIGAGRLA
jgi:putative membrane protein